MNNLMKRKGKIVVDKWPYALQHKLISLYHDTAIGGFLELYWLPRGRKSVLLDEVAEIGEQYVR